MHVTAFFADADGSSSRRAERRAAWPSSHEDARRIGEEIGAELLAR